MSPERKFLRGLVEARKASNPIRGLMEPKEWADEK
jgi:hypothetical protein